MKFLFITFLIPFLAWGDPAADAVATEEKKLEALQKMLMERSDISDEQKESLFKDTKRKSFVNLCVDFDQKCDQLTGTDKELVEKKKKRNEEIKAQEGELTKKLGEGWEKLDTPEAKEAMLKIKAEKYEKNKAIFDELCKKNEKDAFYFWDADKMARSKFLHEEELCLVERTHQVEVVSKGSGSQILKNHVDDYAKYKSCKPILENDKKALASATTEETPKQKAKIYDGERTPPRGPAQDQGPEQVPPPKGPRLEASGDKVPPPLKPEGDIPKIIIKAPKPEAKPETKAEPNSEVKEGPKKGPTDEEKAKAKAEEEKAAQLKAEAAKKLAEEAEENEDEKSPRNYDPETCEWAKDLPRRVVYGPSCGKNMTRICTGHVVCNQKFGGAKFVRMSTCGPEHCGGSARDAINCTKQNGYFSRKAKDESKEFMSQKVKKVIQGSTKQ